MAADTGGSVVAQPAASKLAVAADAWMKVLLVSLINALLDLGHIALERSHAETRTTAHIACTSSAAAKVEGRGNRTARAASRVVLICFQSAADFAPVASKGIDVWQAPYGADHKRDQ
jgi:hypothetical protein